MAEKIRPNWIDPDEFEIQYKMKKTTQALYRSKKKIPFAKIGGFIYYDTNKIDLWIEEHSNEVMVS